MHCSKVINFCTKSISVIFFIVLAICSFFTLFHFPNYYLPFQHSTVKTLFFAGVAATIFWCWDSLLKERSKKSIRNIYLFTCCCLLFIQVLFFLKTATPIGWDVLEILNSAEFGMYNGDYFAKYPNNLFLQNMLTAYLSMTKFIPFLSSLRKFILLNLFFVDISILMSVLIAKKAYGQQAANRVFICAILLIAFHPTLSVVYSDTLAMPFPIGSLFFFTYGKNATTFLKKSIFYALSFSFGVIGFFIKPTALIVLIALLIFALLFFSKKYFCKSTVLLLLTSSLISGVLCGSASYIRQSSINELQAQYPNEKARSFLHYIALGLYTPPQKKLALH